MTPALRWYLGGLAMVTLIGVLAGLRAGPGSSAAVWLACVLSFMVQGPLGWWLVRSIGRPEFMVAWVVGMLARITLLVLMAFVLLPLLGWPLEPGLLAAAGLLVAMLVVESVVALRAGPSTEAK
jgi:heme A synthase